ncbi:MAG: DUF4124 domain-containing protein [Gammaproteobacteria bacterium]|nr:DUF4124 domain-containing protein [Gammaproteobacteria bacterium]
MRLITIFLMLITANANAEIYKTLNPDGSTSYSDVESPDSKVIIPPKLTTAPAVKYPKKTDQKSTSKNDKPLPYKTFTITSPINQAVIRDNNGNATVSLSIEPALQTKFKHSISIFLNGKAIKTGLTTATTQINNLDRGSHTFSAQILSESKAILKTSKSVTVHIKHHSKLHKKPANPYAPTPAPAP